MLFLCASLAATMDGNVKWLCVGVHVT